MVASSRPMPAIGDAGRVEPAFAAHIAARPPAFERCLVPGCGRGHAVECLARSGRHAIGLEISSLRRQARTQPPRQHKGPYAADAWPGGGPRGRLLHPFAIQPFIITL